MIAQVSRGGRERAMDVNMREFIDNWPLFKDRIVLLLGAGASYGALSRHGRPLPNGYELRNLLWAKLKHAGPKPFDPEELKLMPLEHAAAIIESKVGRPTLVQEMTAIFDCEKPMWQHAALPHLQPKAVLTTNYDELVELGFKHHSGLADVICDDREPMPGRVPLFKPHGSLSHANQPIGRGGLVITQFDYFNFIESYRGMLARAMTGFNASCVVAIGYSFSDMDIGATLYGLRAATEGTPWYAVFPRADPQVRKMYARNLRIEQIDATCEGFLRQLDEAVDFIPGALKAGRIPELRAAGEIQ